MEQNKFIQIFITGGTFDKEYNFVTGQLYFKDSHLGEMLDRGRCSLEVDVKTLMMIDSLEMTDADRAMIIHQCKTCKKERAFKSPKGVTAPDLEATKVAAKKKAAK